MAKKNVWVTSAGSDGWKVRTEGSERAASVHDTQREAIEHGKQIARNAHSELIVQGSDGRIRARDSYGNDPKRSKG